MGTWTRTKGMTHKITWLKSAALYACGGDMARKFTWLQSAALCVRGNGMTRKITWLKSAALYACGGDMARKITWLKSTALYICGELKCVMFVTVLRNVAELQQNVGDGCWWLLGLCARLQWYWDAQGAVWHHKDSTWVCLVICCQNRIRNVDVSDLQISTFLWMDLYFFVEPSLSKKEVGRYWSTKHGKDQCWPRLSLFVYTELALRMRIRVSGNCLYTHRVSRIRAGLPRNLGSIADRSRGFSVVATSKLTLGPIQPHV